MAFGTVTGTGTTAVVWVIGDPGSDKLVSYSYIKMPDQRQPKLAGWNARAGNWRADQGAGGGTRGSIAGRRAADRWAIEVRQATADGGSGPVLASALGGDRL